MRCGYCGNVQGNGHFCGNCGVRLGSVNNAPAGQTMVTSEQQAIEPEAAKVESSVQLDNLKKGLQAYRSYFKQQLKSPSLSFTDQEGEFRNGVISLILYAIIFGLSFFIAINGVLQASIGGITELVGEMYDELSFFSVFINVFVFIVISMGIVSLGLFLISKYFGPDHTYKKIVVHYGAHSLPAIVVGLIALGLLLIKSYVYGSFIMLAGLIYVIVISSGYVMSALLSRQPKGIDPLHGFTLYVIVVILLFAVLYKFIGDTALGNYLENLRSLL